MESIEIASRTAYRLNDTGICRLAEDELSGPYPSWFSDSEVNSFNTHWKSPSTLSQLESFVHSLINDSSKQVWAIYSLRDSIHIGNISLQLIDHFNQTAELAFLLGEKKYWGKGYGADAARLVMEHAFKHLNLQRIYLGCFENNIGMNKLAMKLGFVQEGVRRKAVFNQGKFRDVVEYGILKNEFEDNTDC